MKISCNIDRHEYTSKPGKKEVAYYVQRRLAEGQEEIEISELAQILVQGCTFKPALLKGSRGNTWQSQQLFAIDFDPEAKTTIEKELAKCRKYHIMPAFGYKTFSYSDEVQRFRFVFCSDVAITDIRVRNVIQYALMLLFSNTDQVTKDFARLFFGGKELISTSTEYQEYPIFSAYWLIQDLIDALKNRNPKYCRDIDRFCQICGLNEINGRPDVRFENGQEKSDFAYTQNTSYHFPVVYNFSVPEGTVMQVCSLAEDKKPKKPQKYNINKVKNKKRETIQNFDFVALEKSCQLWREFVNCERWCVHQEIFMMSTCMATIRGGEKIMLETIEKNKQYQNDFSNLTSTVENTSKYNYTPMRCENACPYHEQCKNKGVNMLQSVDNKRGNIRKLHDVEKADIDDLEIGLHDAIQEAWEAEDTDIHVIKAPTGAGKTMALRDLDLVYTCVAYPNHQLGTDIVERLQTPNCVHVKDLVLENEDMYKKFNQLRNVGASKASKDMLFEYAKNPECSEKDKKEIKNYYDNIAKSRTTCQPVFCTHARAFILHNSNIKTYIFDEDVLLSTVFQTMPLNKYIVNETRDYCIRLGAGITAGFLLSIKEAMEAAIAKPGQVQPLGMRLIQAIELNMVIKHYHDDLQMNIRDAMRLRAVVADKEGNVSGILVNQLPDAKIIILSASANEQIYKAAFEGDNELTNRTVHFTDLGTPETSGHVILHYTSFSRSALKQNFSKAVKKIKEEAPNINNIITFIKFEEKFAKEGLNPICHYGKCQGLDSYKGEDLIVAGTPHMDSKQYLLVASMITKEKIINQPIEFTNVCRNGFEFFFPTFSGESSKTTEILREIQFYLIETELVQAVGRARVLRTSAMVHVFADLPMPGWELYQEK